MYTGKKHLTNFNIFYTFPIAFVTKCYCVYVFVKYDHIYSICFNILRICEPGTDTHTTDNNYKYTRREDT